MYIFHRFENNIINFDNQISIYFDQISDLQRESVNISKEAILMVNGIHNVQMEFTCCGMSLSMLKI